MQRGQAVCGAKTRKGSTCKDIAMPNGRCKRHGGESSGPDVPNPLRGAASPARRHGIYEDYYTEEEKALDIISRLGSVDGELEMVRIRLRRTLAARAKWELEIVAGRAERQEDGSLVLVEVVDDEAVFEGVRTPTKREVRRLPNFDDIEHRCLARIESLEKTRKELMKDSGGELPDGSGARDRVKFTGGLGGDDGELPSPFE
jgi:hypothetical protein